MLDKHDTIETIQRPTTPYSVPPVVRAIKLLRFIAAGNSIANQSNAARAIGINRTTLLRLVHTLEAEGLIDRVHGSDNYVLGAGIIELAAHKIHSLDVAQAASPVLERLAASLGLSSHLGLLDGREIVYVLRSAPSSPLISNVHVGTRFPAHATTMGRAILAHVPANEVSLLYRGVALMAVTAKTATTIEALRRQLDVVLATGVAVSRSNFEAGIGSVAAPVFDHAGKVACAINVSGPEHAFEAVASRARIVDAVRASAAEISKRLGFVAPVGPSAAPTRTSPKKRSRS